jgi:hypothetical protein
MRARRSPPLGIVLIAFSAACVQPREGQRCDGGAARDCAAGYTCAADDLCHPIGQRQPSRPEDSTDGGAATGDSAPPSPDVTTSSATGGAGAAGSGGSGPIGGVGGETGGPDDAGGISGGAGGVGGVPTCALGSARLDHCRLP